MSTISSNDLQQSIQQLSGWGVRPNAIAKDYHFADFKAAMAFVNRVADLAEAANHHPDISISWNRVTLTLSSHAAGGVTDRDLSLARDIEAVVAG